METQPRAAESANQPVIGRTIANRYRIGGLLGSGAMGSVYAAQHLELQSEVAVKILHHSDKGPGLERFRTEARALGSLRHPHIVSVLDFGVTDDGLAYMVAERLEGCTLAELIGQHGALPEHWVLELLQQLLRALEFAHQRDVVHRDIKPSNCFCVAFEGFEQPPRCKLLDFGVAKLLGTELEGPSATQAGEIIGTAVYMSPEQAGGAAVDARTDLYSVGVMAYELLTGTPPFAGATAVDVLWQHLHAEAPAMLAQNPQCQVSAAAEALVFQALEKDPTRRYPNAQEFLDAVDGAHDNVDARDPRPGDRRWWRLGVGGLGLSAALATGWWVASPKMLAGVSDPTPRSCADLHAAHPEVESGRYLLDVDGLQGEVRPFEAYCDMERDGGGWTLAAIVHRAQTQGLPGQHKFLSYRLNEHLLRGDDPAKGTIPVHSSHGRERLAPLVAAAEVSRFVIVAQEDPDQRAAWFKALDADGFFSWFTATDHAETQVCADPQMTQTCTRGRIKSEHHGALSGAEGRVTTLEGMNLGDRGYDAKGDVHVRFVDDDLSHLAGACSYTFSDQTWADSLDGHWGNGIEIWLR